MIRRADILLAAGAATVAVLVGVTVAGTRSESRPGPAEAPAATAEPARPASALFIGDSVTDTTPLAEMSYACRTAVQMRWLCSVSAVPGTGYISGGPSNRFSVDDSTSASFAERIPKLATEYAPDVVVLDGGRNDLFPPAADVGKAMIYTIGEARRAWPQATIVFVRPRYLAHPGDDLGFDDGFMARLESDPAAAGVVFVDPVADARFRGDTSTLIGPDGRHQNAAGDQQLADALVAALRARGIEAAS